MTTNIITMELNGHTLCRSSGVSVRKSGYNRCNAFKLVDCHSFTTLDDVRNALAVHALTRVLLVELLLCPLILLVNGNVVLVVIVIVRVAVAAE
jgi:hypothetical protein